MMGKLSDEEEDRTEGLSDMDLFLEDVARGIYKDIETLKRKFADFDWHGEDRDRRFFYLKCAMDLAWRQILDYRIQCYEAALMTTVDRAVEDVFDKF